jgi:hypothetical protein
VSRRFRQASGARYQGLAGVFPDVRPVVGPLTGGMLKVIGIVALVVIAIALLGHVAKAVLWIALIAVLVVIGRAVYKAINKRNSETPNGTLR